MIFELEAYKQMEADFPGRNYSGSSSPVMSSGSPFQKRKKLAKLEVNSIVALEFSRNNSEMELEKPSSSTADKLLVDTVDKSVKIPSISVFNSEGENQSKKADNSSDVVTMSRKMFATPPRIAIQHDYDEHDDLMSRFDDKAKTPYPFMNRIKENLLGSNGIQSAQLKSTSKSPFNFNNTNNNYFNTSHFGANLNDSVMSHWEDNSRISADYDDVEEIGKGSFGRVYKCIGKLDRREYAVKKIKKNPFEKKKVLPYMRSNTGIKSKSWNEPRNLAYLASKEDSDAVVRYYNAWEDEDGVYVVMEYCVSSLAKMKKEKGKFSESELEKVVQEIGEGLDLLHRYDIAHLDVKSDNILVSTKGKFKLGDLGRSKLLTNNEAIEDGDARYLAPEFLNSPGGKKDYKMTDIFSFGIVLYELATGRELLKNGEEWQQLRQNEFVHLDKVDHIGADFIKFIKKILSRNPRKRPTASVLKNFSLEKLRQRQRTAETLMKRDIMRVEGKRRGSI